MQPTDKTLPSVAPIMAQPPPGRHGSSLGGRGSSSAMRGPHSNSGFIGWRYTVIMLAEEAPMHHLWRPACNILLLACLLWSPQQAVASDRSGTNSQMAARQLAGQDAERTQSVPEGWRPPVVELPAGDRSSAKRIASVLQKVKKNLILEGTRGNKETEIYRKAAPAVVLVITQEGFGSGAIIDGVGHVITNWHVVGSYPQVVVVFKPRDGTEIKKELAFGATVERVDQTADLALLQINSPPKAFVSLPLGDATALKVGQDVHAIGHPEGEVWTYTKGIISQVRAKYRWTTGDGRSFQAKVIQTQTPVNPGNSGGPLLDDNVKLVGINSFRGRGEGLNYAVAVDEIQAFLQRAGGQPSTPAAAEPRCVESYDTKGQGWIDIVGCYYTATAPPPDLWVVARAPRQPAAYAAFASQSLGAIDTVIKSPDQQWERLEYYVDVDCNGTVDLVQHQRKGSGLIDSYSLPQKPLRLVMLAKELDSAIKRRKLPYPKLRVCQ